MEGVNTTERQSQSVNQERLQDVWRQSARRGRQIWERKHEEGFEIRGHALGQRVEPGPM